MNAPEKIRLTEFSHGGGCGCKIAPAVLSEILAASPIRGLPKDLLVGTETSDDAAVYRLNDTQAIVATTDFLLAVTLLAGLPITLVVYGLFGTTSEIVATFAWILAISFVANGAFLVAAAPVEACERE